MKWFRLYVEIKDDPKTLELSDAQFRIWINLLAMTSEADERGVIAAYRPRGLAAALRTTPDLMEEAFALFCELGMIERREDGSMSVSHFIERQYDNPSDRPDKVAERKARHKERQESAAELPPAANGTTRNDTGTTQEREQNAEERLYSDTDSENTPPNPPGEGMVGDGSEKASAGDSQAKPPHRSAILLRFDEFYSAYPLKRNRAAAEKAWDKLKPDSETLSAMLTALSWQVRSRAWTKDGGQFVPHPATYLNAGGWLDEPEVESPGHDPPEKGALLSAAKPDGLVFDETTGQFLRQAGITQQTDLPRGRVLT